MTEPDVPPQNIIRPVGDGSVSVWGKLALPLARRVPGAPLLPGWTEHGELLRDADPARFFLLDFLIWKLNFDLTQRLAFEGVETSTAMPQAVVSVGLVDPEPYMQTDGNFFRFPLLSLFRKSSRSDWVTVTYPYREGKWVLRYTLPSMSYETASKLDPIFAAVEASIESSLYAGNHPQYTPPGGVPGDLVFDATHGGLMEVESGDSAWDHYVSEGEGLVHPSYQMELLVKIRKGDVASLPAGSPGAPVPFTGIDASISVAKDSADTNPVPVVALKTDA